MGGGSSEVGGGSAKEAADKRPILPLGSTSLIKSVKPGSGVWETASGELRSKADGKERR